MTIPGRDTLAVDRFHVKFRRKMAVVWMKGNHCVEERQTVIFRCLNCDLKSSVDTVSGSKHFIRC